MSDEKAVLTKCELKWLRDNKRSFYGEEHFLWAVQQYEAARVFLKNCGRPNTDHDRWLIAEAKFDSVFFKRYCGI